MFKFPSGNPTILDIAWIQPLDVGERTHRMILENHLPFGKLGKHLHIELERSTMFNG
jgi:hypothetical protein